MAMIRKCWIRGTLGLVILLCGCGFWDNVTDDCERMLTCDHFVPTGHGGGGTNPACEPDPTEDASTVTDECAVFASTNAAPGGDGTKEKPYASLAEAVANAHGKRVLACTSGAFAESVTIEAGVEVIGGFDCDAGWTWSEAARSAIEGPPDQIALTLGEGANGAKVRSFAVRAASATKAGGSSIGVAVADIEAELVQVEVTASDGMAGADGKMPIERPYTGASGSTNTASFACIMDVSVYGGDPGVTICEDGETRGGQGGLGGIPGMDDDNGRPGQAGTPLPDPILPDSPGLGGMGQTEMSECEQGRPGRDGASDTHGAAGRATTLALTGIAGGDGAPGITGKKGQGGGGGGGAKAGYYCGNPRSPVEASGASGGGGGAGGCGGKGGGGGQAGGSSIGILSLGTKLVLTEVTVAAGKAGNGGKGGLGRPGASGGSGGTAGDAGPLGGSGCNGGRGGTGGRGGLGGGGRGGHAVGIAYAAAPSAAVELKDFKEGAAGDGGQLGFGDNAGTPGVSAACWSFGGNESCGQ
ncbi:hypothetical protein [Sorangium sp. So ce381]|uniref:hypothetical protein n=1 Tax=Sorangium sp. So ce381 TaxID=3133307 RepID=UPI003F5C63C1